MSRAFVTCLVLALVALLLIVLLMWRGRRSVAVPAAAASVGTRKPRKPLRWVTLRDAVRRRYAVIERAVRYLLARRDWRYRSNWLLLLGMSGDGKSSLAASVPDDLLRRPGGSDLKNEAWLRAAVPHTQWRFLDRGALIDPDGATSPGQGDEVRWHGILDDIESLRPDRAVDGLVWALSASRLLAADPAALDAMARTMFSRVYSVQEQYAYALPVYLVVTHVDQVPGFEAFWSAQDPALRRQIVGWSSATLDDDGTPAEWTEKLFARLIEGLRTLVLASAATRDRIDDVDDFFLFPQHIRRLQAPLQRVLDVVFKPNMYETRAFCRGIYFVGPDGSDHDAGAAPRKDIGFLADLLAGKIFYERGLAQRTRKGILARNRLLRGLQIGTAVVALLLAAALPWAASQVSARGKALHDMIVDVAASSDALARGGCLDARHFDDLVAQIAHLDTHTRYVAIPASWVDRRINDGVIRTVSGKALDQVLLPSLACELQKRIDTLSSAVLAPAGSDVAPDVAFRRVHQQLDDQLAQLATLEDALARFKALSRPDFGDGGPRSLLAQFAEVSRYVYGKPLPREALAGDGALGAALSTARYDRPPEISHDRQRQLIARFDSMAGDAANDLVQRVASGPLLLAGLKSDHPPVLPTLRAFNSWLSWIGTAWVLSTPAANPCAQEVGALRPGVDVLVARHGYEASLRAALTHFDDEHCYAPAIRTLRQAAVPPYGPLFTVDAATRQLRGVSPGLAAEASGLHALTGLGFMQRESAQTFSCDGSAGGFRAGAFDEVLGELREYQEFDANQRQAEPVAEGTEPLYERIAHAQLARTIEDSLARNQRQRVGEGDTPGLDAVSTLDRELATESAALGGSLGPMLQSLQQLRQERFGSLADRVGQCARNYASGMLMDVSGLASASKLYDPPVQSPSEDGGAAMFDLGGTPVLQAYLQRQLARAQVLAGYAAPFVTLLKNSRGTSDSRRLNAQSDVYWDNTIDQFNRAVQFAEPAGQVAALEDLFLKQLATLTYANCDATLGAYRPQAGGNDLFSARRDAMLRQAQLACSAQGQTGSELHFYRIAMLFNSEVAGRYPFGPVDAHEVTADTVKAFFVYYAKEKADLGKWLATAKGDRAAQMRAFIGQLDAVQAFFAGNLSVSPVSAPITLGVGFRAQPEASPMSNQLVGWTLSSGGGKASWPDATPTLAWNLGQPLSLDLAWADRSRYAPVADPAQADLGVDGYHAVYRAEGPWALLHFIDAHRAPARPGLDADQILLGFDVPALLSTPLSGEEAVTRAHFFMTLRLSAADPVNHAAVPLTLPVFPRQAPEP